MSLRALVNQYVDDGIEDPDEITDRIFDDVDRDELLEMVRPVVRWQVRSSLRNVVRSLERRAFPSTPVASNGRPGTEGTVLDELRNLLGSGFRLPSGDWVTWGEATVSQHQERAAFMRELADSSLETASQHERAAEMIMEAGVTCLAEIEAPKTKKRKSKAAA